MDQAAVFLAGSILFTLGFTVLICAVVVVNNILHKYWKPVRIFTSDSWTPFGQPARYATEEELARIAPHLDAEDGKEKAK
jgi:hypothetical protein